MDSVCDFECRLMLRVQQMDLDAFLHPITLLGDPKACLVLFALLLWVPYWRRHDCLVVGTHFFALLLLTDLSNGWLKFPLRGDRPFWVRPEYKQMGVTCESGFGNPSGHVMASSACHTFLYLAFRPGPKATSFRRLMGRVHLVLLVFLIASVAVSRFYISAHYPHQTVLGGIIGCSMAFLQHSALKHDQEAPGAINRPGGPWYHKALFTQFVTGGYKRALWAGCFLMAFTVAQLAMVTHSGQDPLESIELAKKGCKQGKEGLHATTTPIQGIARDVGMLVGFASLLPLLLEGLPIGLPHDPVPTASRLAHIGSVVCSVVILQAYLAALKAQITEGRMSSLLSLPMGAFGAGPTTLARSAQCLSAFIQHVFLGAFLAGTRLCLPVGTMNAGHQARLARHQKNMQRS